MLDQKSLSVEAICSDLSKRNSQIGRQRQLEILPGNYEPRRYTLKILYKLQTKIR